MLLNDLWAIYLLTLDDWRIRGRGALQEMLPMLLEGLERLNSLSGTSGRTQLFYVNCKVQ